MHKNRACKIRCYLHSRGTCRIDKTTRNLWIKWNLASKNPWLCRKSLNFDFLVNAETAICRKCRIYHFYLSQITQNLGILTQTMQNLAFEIAQNSATFCDGKNEKNAEYIQIWLFSCACFAECCRKMGKFWVICQKFCGCQNLQKITWNWPKDNTESSRPWNKLSRPILGLEICNLVCLMVQRKNTKCDKWLILASIWVAWRCEQKWEVCHHSGGAVQVQAVVNIMPAM